MLITEHIFTNFRCLFGMIIEETVNGVYEKKINEAGSE